MLYLLIDTSSSLGVIALYEDETVLSAKTVPSMELSTRMMISIQSIFSEQKIQLQQLDFLAVGIGPGSFTGTRIGVVSAKAIAYSLNLPIVEFYSLIPFIPSCSKEKFTILSDAKTKQVYQMQGKFIENGQIECAYPTVEPIASFDLNFTYYTPDNSLLKSLPSGEVTHFNFELIGKFVSQEFSKKNLTNAADLKPIYLKSP